MRVPFPVSQEPQNPNVPDVKGHLEDGKSSGVNSMEPMFKSKAPPPLPIPGPPTIKFQIPVARPPFRSKSCNQYIELGEGIGTFSIVQHNDDPSSKLYAQYHDSRGRLYFSSKIPGADQLHHYMKRQSGRGSEFYWEALNEEHEAGGTTIRGAEGRGATGCRRYYFQFGSDGILSMVLFHMIYDGDSTHTASNIVIDFFDETKEFYVDTMTIPSHNIIQMRDENDMDTDDDDAVKAAKPLSPYIAEAVYGNDPYKESQDLWC